MKKRTLAHENDWYYNNYIMRLLIVEDENDLRNIVKKRLVKEHYSVDACGDGLEAMDYIDMTSYDGIILDIMLPGKDGYEILRELRQREDDTPVLLLTAKDSIEDRVKGLDLGADDYLIKPFAFEELLARIRVMMRRKPQFTSNQLKIADLILDRDTRKVTRAGNEIDLSAKEFMVLECLMRNKNIVMTRQQIEQNAWDFDFEGGYYWLCDNAKLPYDFTCQPSINDQYTDDVYIGSYVKGQTEPLTLPGLLFDPEYEEDGEVLADNMFVALKKNRG